MLCPAAASEAILLSFNHTRFRFGSDSVITLPLCLGIPKYGVDGVGSLKRGILIASGLTVTFALALVGAVSLGVRRPDLFAPRVAATSPADAGRLAPAAPVEAAAPRPSVFPPEAADLPVEDLSDLVAYLLPPDGFESLGWDFLAGSPKIAWRTVGVDDSGRMPIRYGYVRARAGGVIATRLLQKKEELVWTVVLTTGGSSKFGPRVIRIAPGGYGDQQCFGHLDDGCSFPASAVLSSAVLKSTLLCKGSLSSGSTVVYRISSPGKQTELLVYSEDGGSGGTTASLEILPVSSGKRACEELRRTGEVPGN